MNKTTQTLLAELNKTSKEFWNISPETGQFIHELILTNPEIRTILEIGTSNGVSGIWMAEALRKKSPDPSTTTKSKTHQLHTIESHKKLRFNLAKENFAKAELTPFITQILGHAPEDLPTEPAQFDLIFLDATKYEHIDYLKTLLPRTHKGTIIITDNAISHKADLTTYASEITQNPSFETHLVEIGTGLLISTRTA